MQKNESVQYFLRYLDERFAFYKSLFENLLSSLVEDNKETKKKKAEDFKDAATSLRNNLANKDLPFWLDKSIKASDHFIKNFNSTGINNYLLRELMPMYNSIMNHEWEFEKVDDILSFDFDAIYEQCKNESRIDELFDNIIDLLKKIIESGEIDSIKVQNTLEKLIATLKKHSTASYLSLHSIWDFLSHLMNNILWEELEDIPGIKGVVKGLRKTIDETGVELNVLRDSMKTIMRQKFNTDFSFLNNGPQNLLENKNKE